MGIKDRVKRASKVFTEKPEKRQKEEPTKEQEPTKEETTKEEEEEEQEEVSVGDIAGDDELAVEEPKFTTLEPEVKADTLEAAENIDEPKEAKTETLEAAEKIEDESKEIGADVEEELEPSEDILNVEEPEIGEAEIIEPVNAKDVEEVSKNVEAKVAEQTPNEAETKVAQEVEEAPKEAETKAEAEEEIKDEKIADEVAEKEVEPKKKRVFFNRFLGRFKRNSSKPIAA